MMQKRGLKGGLLRLLIPFLVLSVILCSAVALASWEYYIEFTVKDTSGTARTGVPVLININTQNLIDAGLVNATATDTRLREVSTDRDYMLGTSDNSTALFIPSLVATQERIYRLYTGYSPAVSTFGIIVGSSGYITVIDDTTLELDDKFDIEIKGWVNTTAGYVSDNITAKASAFNISISAAGSIKADINGGTSVTATSVASGEHTIQVTADGTTLKIFIDTIEEDSSAMGGVGIPDNANNWLLPPNDVMPYIEYLKVVDG